MSLRDTTLSVRLCRADIQFDLEITKFQTYKDSMSLRNSPSGSKLWRKRFGNYSPCSALEIFCKFSAPILIAR